MSAIAFQGRKTDWLIAAMNGRSWSAHQSAHFVLLRHSGQAIEWRVLAEERTRFAGEVVVLMSR
jgi:hypothetical protein